MMGVFVEVVAMWIWFAKGRWKWLIWFLAVLALVPPPGWRAPWVPKPRQSADALEQDRTRPLPRKKIRRRG